MAECMNCGADVAQCDLHIVPDCRKGEGRLFVCSHCYTKVPSGKLINRDADLCPLGTTKPAPPKAVLPDRPVFCAGDKVTYSVSPKGRDGVYHLADSVPEQACCGHVGVVTRGSKEFTSTAEETEIKIFKNGGYQHFVVWAVNLTRITEKDYLSALGKNIKDSLQVGDRVEVTNGVYSDGSISTSKKRCGKRGFVLGVDSLVTVALDLHPEDKRHTPGRWEIFTLYYYNVAPIK